MKIGLPLLLMIYNCVSGMDQSKNNVTWMEAAENCYSKGSVLESNLTLLKDYIKEYNISSFWVGSYSALLPWIEIRGCFEIPVDIGQESVTEIANGNLSEAECQANCIGNDYFVFTDNKSRCLCFNNSEFIQLRQYNASPCFEEQEYRSTQVNLSVIAVYRVLYEDIGQISALKNHMCLSASCQNDQPTSYTPQDCSSYLSSYCRDGDEAQLGQNVKQFWETTNLCFGRSAFVLLFSDNLCKIKTDIQNRNYWIGVFRHWLPVNYMDVTGKGYTIWGKIKDYIHRCYYTTDEGNLELGNCTEEKREFLCKSDLSGNVNATVRTTLHYQTDPLMLEDDKMKTVAIASSVSGTAVAIILVLVVTLICKRRRNVSKEHGFGNIPLSNPYDEVGSTQQSPHYVDIDMKDGLNENYIPLQDNKRPNENYYVLEKIKESEELTNNKTTANQTHRDESAISTVTDDKLFQDEIRQFQPPSLNSSNIQSDKPTPYCIMVLNITETDIDPYVKNTEYDHLNQVVKINPSANEYDHYLPMSTNEDLQTNAKQSHIVNSNYNEVTLAAFEDKHDEN